MDEKMKAFAEGLKAAGMVYLGNGKWVKKPKPPEQSKSGSQSP